MKVRSFLRVASAMVAAVAFLMTSEPQCFARTTMVSLMSEAEAPQAKSALAQPVSVMNLEATPTRDEVAWAARLMCRTSHHRVSSGHPPLRACPLVFADSRQGPLLQPNEAGPIQRSRVL